MEEVLVGGIIGIVGTLLGLIVSEIIKRVGNIKFIKENIEAKFLKKSRSGLSDDKIGKENADMFECDLNLQIYNNKDIPKIFNKLNFVFKDSNISLRENNIKDRETRCDDFGIIRYNDISNIIINPKSLKEIKMRTYIYKNIDELKNCKMYLQYCDISNNKIKEEFILDLRDLD